MIDRRLFVRPSSIPALALCPGRALMEARAVDKCPELLRIYHSQAQQGVLGHLAAAQTISLIYHGTEGWKEPGECLETMRNAFEALEPWTADAARRCVDYAVALVSKAIADGFQVKIHVELQLPGGEIGIVRGGTADLVILCFHPDEPRRPFKIIIADWKLGWLYQGEACDHLQLASYAAMGWWKFEPLSGVEIHLAQGRRKEFSAASFDEKAIRAVSEQIREVSNKAWSGFPEIVPGIEQCRYCKAITLCRAVRERIMNAGMELALFGTEALDRVKLAEDASLAKRFAEEVKLLQKEWVKTNENR